MIDEIDRIIMDHLEKQPEHISCADCGEELKCITKVDRYKDLQIVVERCTCADTPTRKEYRNEI